MIKIYTSSWHEYRGPGRVGICAGMPRGVPAGYRMYKPLAPSWDIIKGTAGIDEYRPRYFAEILAPLDRSKVVADIALLAGDHPPVLMCFERKPLTRSNFCHRTMIAEWLNELDGVQAEEWSGLEESNLTCKAGTLL